MTEFAPKILVRDGETSATVTEKPAYEAPGIEMALTSDELEREALYAGNGSIPVC